MSLKITGSRELITPPKGDKGDKGEDGNSFTPKGKAYGHFESSDDFYDAFNQGQLNYAESFLVDDDEGGTAKVYTIAIRRIGVVDVEDGDAYTIVGTKHLWAASGNVWVDFGEIQGPKGDDGDDGDDAMFYRLRVTEGWARWVWENGRTRILKCTIRGEAWFVRGGQEIPAPNGKNYEDQRIIISYNNNCMIHTVQIANDGTWEDGTNGKYLEDDEYNTSGVGTPDAIVIRLVGKDISDNTQTLDTVTINIGMDGKPGDKGEMGKLGPMGVPAGTYSDIARYTRTDAICPVVEHKDEYWYPAANGTITNSEPSASNSAWKKAENFAVMFVRVFFSLFAKMGEAIFHGAFMFSQNGTVNGQTNNLYEKFDPNNPDAEDNPDKFAPHLYLNFLTGAARMAAGKVKFNADGSGFLAGGKINWNTQTIVNIEGYINALGGTFRGKVIADLFYSPIKVLPQGNYTIDPETEPAHTYMDGQTITEVTLPNAETYMGLELAFFHYIGSRMSGPGELKLKGQIIKGQDEYGMGVMRSSAYVKPGVIVKLFAMNYFWYLTSGELLDEPFFK